MIERDAGRLVHVSSGMGESGRGGRSAYSASKFGLEGLHEALTDEFSGTGVDSVILDPGGGVDTEGFAGHMSETDRASRLDPSVVVEPAVALAVGEGEHGGRYVATEW
jgi:NAD(P)-dependent dehydrogenase (short-subunit alcohol dehydrogenase family)